MITWSGGHVDLPRPSPEPVAERVVCPYRYVQYLNPCTYGYTMAFWDWARWERELDWMALHGINMPLAMEGQESIWQRVWLSLGVTQVELDQFSTGPAHLPWHRMGNINNLDGPLPQGWMQKKAALQVKIMKRMRELGMTPVAPAFAGFVPQVYKRVHPEAKTVTLLWLPGEFKTIPRSTRTFILDPSQADLYQTIGKRFIEAWKAAYGNVSHYLADPFNELAVPVSKDRRYEDLELFGRTIFGGITAGDPGGTWVMQAWAFVYDSVFWDNASVEALLRGIPNERMMLLDYTNDLAPSLKDKYAPSQWQTQNAFFGKAWINGMAHTFGGNNNIKGDLSLMANQPVAALHSPKHGNLQGWAIVPEGIENNEVVYELLTDMGWHSEATDLQQWIPSYCQARYGGFPAPMREAWELLVGSAYGSHIWMTKQAWQGEPGTEPAATGVDAGEKFQLGVGRFLECAPQLGTKELYRNDLIELTVQSVGGHVDQQLALAIQAYRAKQMDVFEVSSGRAIAWMMRMDALLNLRADRRLETWVNAARSWSDQPDEKAYYDENARRLVTTWGWPELSDYASRAWSGLTRDYYAARWAAYFDHLKTGAAFSLDLWQQTWLSSPYEPGQAKPVADLISECQALLQECHAVAGTSPFAAAGREISR